MKRILLISIAIIIASLSLSAQQWEKDGLLWYNVPSYYIEDEEVCALNLNDTLSCNIGEEPFNEFLTKFNKDKKFRNSRYMTTEYSTVVPTEEMLASTLKIFDKKGGFPIRGYAKKMGYDAEYDYTIYNYGFWHYIDLDYIVYSSSFNNRKGEKISIILLFQRIDDLWYCTDAYPCPAIRNALMK